MNLYRLPVFAESWNVAYRKKEPGEALENTQSPFSVIENAFQYWAADPFVFEHDGEAYIFAELYDYIKRRGVIGYYQINGKSKKWKPVITEEYHLSFPFIYRAGNEIYIMPEAHKSRTLYRYRAVQFPDKWEKEEVLRCDVSYVDTTPFRENGKDYAMSFDVEKNKLMLLDFSDGTDSVVSASAPQLRRPAGYINDKDGIRAAQDCESDYGKGLIFYRFELDESEGFREEEIRRVYAQDLLYSKKLYLDGMHTYNCSENYEVIDIKTRRLNALNLIMRVVSKF